MIPSSPAPSKRRNQSAAIARSRVAGERCKVIQTVREKFTCRSCEKITQLPAPFHVIARARAGASLLAMILYAKFGEHQPLNRQSESFAREGIETRRVDLGRLGRRLHREPLAAH